MQTIDEKRAYNRARQRIVYEKFKESRLDVFCKLGNECYLCGKPPNKNFQLHHVSYHGTESDYPRHAKAMNVRLKRVKEAQDNPERFRLLCPPCHRIVTMMECSPNLRIERLKEFQG